MIFFIGAFGFAIIYFLYSATHQDEPLEEQMAEPASIPSPQKPIEMPDKEGVVQSSVEQPIISDPKGRLIVERLADQLADRGCKKTLLPPSTVQGIQNIDTRFIAGKGCVHIIVSNGSAGGDIHLALKSPTRKEIKTPQPDRNIYFVFCPDSSGKYPMKIRADKRDSYTVAAIECPKEVVPLHY